MENFKDFTELLAAGMLPTHPGYPILPVLVARMWRNEKWTLKISEASDQRFDIYIHYTDLAQKLHEAAHRDDVEVTEDGVEIVSTPLGSEEDRLIRRIATLTSAWIAIKRIDAINWYVDIPSQDSSTNRAVHVWAFETITYLLDKAGFNSAEVFAACKEVKQWQ